MDKSQLTINWRTKQFLLLGIVIVFHTIGLIGLQTGSREYFLSLSPLNLLLAMSCLLLSFRQSARLYTDVLIVATIGFLAEMAGVHTHLLFGDYSYGENLGWKLAEVPLIIGVNWVMLSFCAIACVLHLDWPNYLKALLSAALMTGLDYLIEPVAVKSDFWHWNGDYANPPDFNYICWFLVALPLHFYLLKRRTPEQNPVSVGLFVILIVFFGILNFC